MRIEMKRNENVSDIDEHQDVSESIQKNYFKWNRLRFSWGSIKYAQKCHL